MVPTHALALSRLSQVSMTAHDLERATTFYRDTLGMRHLFSVPNMAFFDCSGVRLMLGVPEAGEHDHPGSVLYFDVPDLHAAHAALVERGGRTIGEPHFVAKLADGDYWMGFFKDSEGNTLAITSMRRA